MNQPNNFAIITLHFKDKKFTSIPLELAPNSDNIKLVMTICETGMNTFSMFKIPISETNFVVFSKDQLIETIVEVQIIDSIDTYPIVPAAAPTDELIKS